MLQELNRKGAAGKSSLDTVVARKGCSFLRHATCLVEALKLLFGV